MVTAPSVGLWSQWHDLKPFLGGLQTELSSAHSNNASAIRSLPLSVLRTNTSLAIVWPPGSVSVAVDEVAPAAALVAANDCKNWHNAANESGHALTLITLFDTFNSTRWTSWLLVASFTFRSMMPE